MIQLISRQKGMGDTVEFLTTATGIKYAFNKAQELGVIEKCKCEERKEALNNPDLLINKVFYGSRKDS